MGWPFCFCGNSNNHVLPTWLIQQPSLTISMSQAFLASDKMHSSISLMCVTQNILPRHAMSVADLGLSKGGFWKSQQKSFVEPHPLPVKNLALFGKFVDSTTLFALHYEADYNVLHVAPHLVAGNEITIHGQTHQLLATGISEIFCLCNFRMNFLTLNSFRTDLIRRSICINYFRTLFSRQKCFHDEKFATYGSYSLLFINEFQK